MSLYLEAREVSDEGLRKLLVVQSLRALSDATAQLDLELQEDVAYLANGEYRKAKGRRWIGNTYLDDSGRDSPASLNSTVDM